MRNPEAAKAIPFRVRTPQDTLPDFTFEEYGKDLPGDQRCGALGLPLGDCRAARLHDSAYCYYHDKLQSGLIEPSLPTPEVGPAHLHEAPGVAFYPVWPLPAEGYVLFEDAPHLVVA